MRTAAPRDLTCAISHYNTESTGSHHPGNAAPWGSAGASGGARHSGNPVPRLGGHEQPLSLCSCRPGVIPGREELEQHKENKEWQHQEKDAHQQALHAKERELEGG